MDSILIHIFRINSDSVSFAGDIIKAVAQKDRRKLFESLGQ